MADLLANLNAAFTTTGAETTAKQMDAVATSAKKVQTATEQMMAAQNKAVAAQQELIDIYTRTGALSSDQIKALGGWTSAEKILTSAIKDTATAHAASVGAANAAGAAMSVTGKAATAAAGGFNTAALASAGVTRELVVLAREAARGNFSYMIGSSSLLAQRLGVLTPEVIIIGGAIAALTGLFVAGAVAAKQYTDEMNVLGAIAEGVGAKVGLTLAGLQQASQTGAAAANVSVATAEKQAQAYAATGQIGQETIGGLIGITEDYAALTGEKTPAAMKELAAAFSNGAKGAEELNSKFGFLNATQLTQIEQMAKSGDQLGFQKALYDALQPVLVNTEAHLRSQTDAWGVLSKAIGDAWTNLGKFLSGEGDQNKIQQLQDAIQHIQTQGPVSAAGANLIKGYQEQIDKLTASAKNAAAAVQNISVNKGQAIVDQYDLSGTKAYNDLLAQQTQLKTSLAAANTRDQAAAPGIRATLDAVTTAVNQQKQAYAAGLTPEIMRNNLVAAAHADQAKATSNVEKAAAAAELVKANAFGKVSNAAQVASDAHNAYTVAVDKADKSGMAHAATLAREAASIVVNTDATLAAAAAYLQSTAAGDAAMAAAKARTAAVKDGLSPDQEAVRIASDQALADAQAIAALAKKATATADQADAQKVYNAQVAAGAISSQQAADAIAIENTLLPEQERLAKLSGQAHDILAAAINKERAALEASNVAKQQAQQLAANDNTQNQIAYLQAEATLVGASNEARAVELAQLKAIQEIRAQQGPDADLGSSLNADTIRLAGEAAKAQVTLTADTANYNETLGHTADMLSLMNDRAQTLGQGLSDAFGQGGDALGKLLGAMTSYAAQESAIRQKEAADIKANTVASTASYNDILKSRLALAQIEESTGQQLTNSQVARTEAELQGIKSIFSEQSGAYKAITVIQQVYYAEQFAMQAEAIAKDLLFTTSSVANSGVRAAADGVAAFAKTLASLPFPFNLAAGAAVLAALAGVGVAIAGGGSSPAIQSAADYQKTVGTGTVLGSPDAQSTSITKALDDAAKDQNDLLSVNNQMLQALRAINNNIAGLTSQIARQLGVSGGAFDTSGMGLGTSVGGLFSGGVLGKVAAGAALGGAGFAIGAAIGGIAGPIGALIGGALGLLVGSVLKTTTTVSELDKGLQFQTQAVSNLMKAVDDASYVTLEIKKKTSLFGITLSSSDKTQTVTGSVADDLNSQIQLVIGSLQSGVLAAASVLGVKGAKATLDALQINLGKLSFEGLDAQGISDELNAAFSKVGDQMAAAIAPSLTSFQQAGEGLMDTLVRLANEYQVTDQVFAETGVTFTQTGIASLKARDALVQLAGGLDNFTSQADAYAQAILTPAQQLAPVQKAVADAMSALGLASIDTKAEFATVVQSLDLTTAGGQQLYTTLMAIAPAFGKVADAAADLVSQARDLQEQLLQAQGDTATATAMQRADALAQLDPSLQPIQAAIYAYADLATAQQTATDAANALSTANDNLASAQASLASLQQQAADKAAQAAVDALQAVSDAASQTLSDANSALSDANQQLQSAQQGLVAAYNKQKDALQSIIDGLTTAQNNLATAYQTQAQSLQSTISQFQQFTDALTQFNQSLDAGSASALSPQQQAVQARGVFNTTVSAATSGDTTAMGQIQTVAQQYLTAAQAVAPTAAAYARDVAAVRAGVEKAEDYSKTQVSMAQQQLDALTATVTALGVLSDNTLSVQQAIDQLQTAQQAATAAQQQLDAMTTQVGALVDISDGVMTVQAAIQNLTATQAAQAAASLAQQRAQTAATTAATNVQAANNALQAQQLAEQAASAKADMAAAQAAMAAAQSAAANAQQAYSTALSALAAAQVQAAAAAATAAATTAATSTATTTASDAAAAAAAAAAAQARANAAAEIIAGDPTAVMAFYNANPDLQASYQSQVANHTGAPGLQGETILQFAQRQYLEMSAAEQAARKLFALGGYVSGPGSGTSDSIPARLSNGEYVVNAAATAQYLGVLQAMNAGAGLPAMPIMASPPANDNGMAAALDALRAEMAAMRAEIAAFRAESRDGVGQVATNTAKGANETYRNRRLLEQVSNGGVALQVTDAA